MAYWERGEEGEGGRGISAGAPSGISSSNRCFMVETETTHCSPSLVKSLLCSKLPELQKLPRRNQPESSWTFSSEIPVFCRPGSQRAKAGKKRWHEFFCCSLGWIFSVALCATSAGCGSEGETQQPGTNHSPVCHQPDPGPANQRLRSDLWETKLVFIYWNLIF